MADNDNNLNEEVTMVVEDANVITTPIDDTLTVSGDAADAKAVGDALALKADLSQITDVTVNGQSPDDQGAILIDGGDIPVSSDDSTTIDAALAALDEKTGADIAIDGETGSDTIANVVSGIQDVLDTFEADTTGFTAGTNITMTTTRAVKIGNLIMLVLAGTLGDGASITTGTTICTIPDDYIPDATVHAIAGCFDRNGTVYTQRCGSFLINTSGQLRQNLTSSWTSGNFGMTFLYPAPAGD